MKEQRRHYVLLKNGKKSHMTQDRIRQLNQLGFRWDTLQESWLKRFNELERFQSIHGHCNVPSSSSSSSVKGRSPLAAWVQHQRRKYRGLQSRDDSQEISKTASARINALNELGFEWWPERKSPSRRAAVVPSQRKRSLSDDSMPLKKRKL